MDIRKESEVKQPAPISRHLTEIVGLAILIAVCFTLIYSYPLFHNIVEILVFAITLSIFFFIWNAHRFLDNNYLLFFGIACLFIGILDLAHVISSNTPGIANGDEANIPTQFWIAMRYLQSLSLLIAPVFLGKRLKLGLVFVSYFAVTVLIFVSILYWRIFPESFIEGAGLTTFKKASELIISAIFLASIFPLLRKRREFDHRIFQILIAFLIVSTISEIAFAYYTYFPDPISLVGHILLFISFYLVYKAIIETGLTQPYNLLFRNLKQNEMDLQKARSELEMRVQERTAQLSEANRQVELELEERKQIQASLQESEEFSSSLLTNSPNPILVINPDNSIRYINPAFEKLTGFKSGEVTGIKPSYPWWTEETMKETEGDFKKLVNGKLKTSERLFKNKDGERFWVEINNASVVKNGQLKYYLVNWVDITELKRISESLQFYVSEITRAQEEERKRIACELHDDTAQSISILSLGLDAILKNKDYLLFEITEQLEQLRQRAGTILEGVRRLSYNLRPSVLDHLGLVPALEFLAEELAAEKHIDARVDVSGDAMTRLPSDLELTLFRIAQEALTNIRKYSQATKVLINIEFIAEKVNLNIVDNGVGFELPDKLGDLLTGKKKMGLVGMQERVHLLCGTFNIHSEVGKGTTITVEISLNSL